MKYETHVGLVLELHEDSNLVTLSGDNRKVLYEGSDEAEALKVFTEVAAHYEERKKAETSPTS